MRTALTDHQAFDGIRATGAGLAGAAKYIDKGKVTTGSALEGIKIGLAVAQGGTRVFQTLSQHLADGSVQLRGLFGIEFIRIGQRMQAGFPQGFVHVYIAQPGNKGLVQQERLELTFADRQKGSQLFGRETSRQGLRPQVPGDGLVGGCQVGAPEFAGIVKSQLAAVIQPNDQVVVPGPMGAGPGQHKPAGHAQVKQEIQLGLQMENDIFSTAGNRGDCPFTKLPYKIGGILAGNGFGPEHPGVGDAGPRYTGGDKIVNNGLNFG